VAVASYTVRKGLLPILSMVTRSTYMKLCAQELNFRGGHQLISKNEELRSKDMCYVLSHRPG
jgi:hypothetical protein